MSSSRSVMNIKISLEILTFTTTGAPSTVVLIDDAGIAANAEAALLEVDPVPVTVLVLALAAAAVIVSAVDVSELMGFGIEVAASVIVESSFLTDDCVWIFSSSD